MFSFMAKVTFNFKCFAHLKHLISEHFAGLAVIITSADDEETTFPVENIISRC